MQNCLERSDDGFRKANVELKIYVGENLSSKSGHPSQKKALAEASAFFNEARLAAHEASCEATREAGLRPMKRAFGTRRRKSALRFMRASRAHHSNAVAAS